MRSRSNHRLRLISATIVVALLFIVDLLSGGMVRMAVRSFGSTVWGAIGSMGSGKAALERENAELKATIASLQASAGNAQALEAENEQLRALTHLAASAPGIAAPVVSSFSASPYGTFIIGAGTSEGVAVGGIVMTPDGFAVGKVSNVSAHQASVVELFASGQKIDVLLDGVPVALAGNGGGVAEAQLPGGTEVVEGAIAIAPSLGQKPVGIVGNVAAASSSPVVKLLVRIPSNLSALTYVYVEAAH